MDAFGVEIGGDTLGQALVERQAHRWGVERMSGGVAPGSSRGPSPQGMGHGVQFGGFECLGRNFRVVVDQVLEGFAALKATEHGMDRNARSVNDRCAAEDIGM